MKVGWMRAPQERATRSPGTSELCGIRAWSCSLGEYPVTYCQLLLEMFFQVVAFTVLSCWSSCSHDIGLKGPGQVPLTVTQRPWLLAHGGQFLLL